MFSKNVVIGLSSSKYSGTSSRTVRLLADSAVVYCCLMFFLLTVCLGLLYLLRGYA